MSRWRKAWLCFTQWRIAGELPWRLMAWSVGLQSRAVRPGPHTTGTGPGHATRGWRQLAAAVHEPLLGEVARCQDADGSKPTGSTVKASLFQVLGAEGRIAIAQHNLGHVAVPGETPRRPCRFSDRRLTSTATPAIRGGSLHASKASLVCWLGRGQAVPAVRILALTMTMHQEAGATIAPADLQAHERYLSSLRAQLDDLSFASAWARGSR